MINLNRSNQTVIILLITLIIHGCASQNTSSSRGREIQIRYAEVLDVERVPMPSAAPAGAIVGGFTGLVLSSRGSTAQRIAATAGGAAVGGLAAKVLEGDNRGYGYRIRYLNGSESRFITEKDYFRPGDCVAVERGNTSNLRRVPDSLCKSERVMQPDPVHLDQAEQCARAKDLLLAATTNEEIDAAARKVEIICQF